METELKQLATRVQSLLDMLAALKQEKATIESAYAELHDEHQQLLRKSDAACAKIEHMLAKLNALETPA